MSRIRYQLPKQSLTACADAALLLPEEDPREELAKAIIETIALDVKVTLGNVTVDLAMIQDPGMWSEEWAAAGISDPDEFIAGLIADE